ncbi:probable serine/threonine-protein kinase PBL19 isoform X1 [Cucurbita moschata]|uniref:Probable serine/threonine-protein kinase PBL19 isoform X1 n=2 Tax=Cucurbita moschata TaxID=3662 RepID=A0A6J1FDF0_CUCMO|nr:probable serine/threonine-protein kinase PBL19 isoform X1 [Cucurbita moschata]
MKCFFNPKGKSKSKGISKSAPELNQGDKSNNSATKNGFRPSNSLPSRSIPELYKEKEHNLRVFSLQELIDATNGFSRMLKIGEGGFGSVYRGRVKPSTINDEPVVVAIKKLNQHSLQGHKEWLAEVQFLSVVDHPNLVKLLGYAAENGERGIQRLLVYEFLPNRSLEHHLFQRMSPTLPWKKRVEISIGAAQGLAYLHGGLETQVIYRDFKSSNVLLDENFKPKLSDFGLAREGPSGDHTHVSTAVVGTHGYAAPEYVETGRLKSQCDVWSFGVVLYELLTGRRALDRNRPTGEQKLLQWVRQFPVDSSMFTMLIDPRLRNQYSLSSAREVAKLADRCLNKNAMSRPTMTEVVESLQKALVMSEEKTSSSSSSSQKQQSHGVVLSPRFVDQKHGMIGRRQGKV